MDQYHECPPRCWYGFVHIPFYLPWRCNPFTAASWRWNITSISPSTSPNVWIQTVLNCYAMADVFWWTKSIKPKMNREKTIHSNPITAAGTSIRRCLASWWKTFEHRRSISRSYTPKSITYSISIPAFFDHPSPNSTFHPIFYNGFRCPDAAGQ